MKRLLALVFAALVITMPAVFATQLNLTYDANGNLVTGDGKYRVYNSLNQLWKIYNGSSVNGTLLETYLYHPTEERVWEKVTYNSSGSVKETVYYFDQSHVRVVNSSGPYDYIYVYQNGEFVAQKNPDGSVYYIHGDNKGSTSIVTNSTGGVVERDTYDPYGNPLNNSIIRYGYEAKEADSILGDTDFNARRYSPSISLFEQPDSLVSNVYSPQNLNRYSFESNNPYIYIDPTGHDASQSGFGYTGGLALGGGGEGGFIVSQSDDGTVEYGVYAEGEGGAYAGAGHGGGFTQTYYPRVQHIKELGGQGMILGVNAYLGGGVTGKVVWGPRTSGGFLNFDSRPIGYGYDLGGGTDASGYGFVTYTKVFSMDSFHADTRLSGSQLSGFAMSASKVYTNKNIDSKTKSSVISGMANTAASGKDINWYYNSGSKTYTWRADQRSPSGSGWSKI